MRSIGVALAGATTLALAAGLTAIPASARVAGGVDAGLSMRSAAPQPAGKVSQTPEAGYPGTPPMWVVHPYIKNTGKKARIQAELYVDPYRRPGAGQKKKRHMSSLPDRLRLRVTVAKKGHADPKTPRTVNVLPSRATLWQGGTTSKVSERGTAKVAITLPKRVSRKLLQRKKRARLTSVAVQVSHWKDTFGSKKNTPKWGAKQVNDAGLQPNKASRKERRHYLRVAQTQTKVDRSRVNVVPDPDNRVQAAWAGNSPMYNYVYVTNSTPFVQKVSFNPNLQCMWTGGAKQNPDAAVETLETGATMQVAYVLEPDPFTSKDGTLWAGLNGATGGMNAPGTQDSIAQDMVNAATKAGQSLLGSAEQTSTYNEAGAVAAVGNAALTFLFTALGELIDASTCNQVATYPETFAVTTTVVGFVAQGVQEAWGADYSNYPSDTWNVTQPIVAPGDTQYWTDGEVNDPAPSVGPDSCIGTNGATATGDSCYWTGPTTVGSQGSYVEPSPCPAPQKGNVGGSNWCSFVYNTLQPMLGAQSTATYYWNGGQPAPMVSNNAPAGSQVGGSASFQGGLFQNVGPNPGLPGDAWCFGDGDIGVQNCSWLNATDGDWLQNYNPMGAMNIALTYLSTPQFTAGMTTEWDTPSPPSNRLPGPTVTAAPATNGSGEPGLQVTCDFSDVTAQLQTPFGANNSSTTVTAADLTNSQTVLNSNTPPSTPTSAQWLVSFYGLDADGNFVYYNPTPGSQLGGTTFNLAPGATTQAVPFNQNDDAQSASGFVADVDLGNMQTLSSIQQPTDPPATAELAKIGCSIVPSVYLPGLDITGGTKSAATAFGAIQGNDLGWPMPGDHTGWPTSLYSAYDSYTNYQWQTPVNQVNVAFQGLPEVATTAVNCTTSACGATPQ